ncbi:aminobenzoate synthetase [Sphingomonas sp. Leaf33]|nr:aminobenzoate synthetase [Sphingomonas sp. Leaf33]
MLDDCRPGGAPARLFRDPVAIIRTDDSDTIDDALARVRVAVRDGRQLAGFLGYEAGLGLEPRLRALARGRAATDPPALWFGVFDRVERIASETLAAALPDPRGAWAGPVVPRVTSADYAEAFERVAEFIRAGDIYQANLSFRADVTVAGDPLALYARLRGSSSAGWGGVIHTGDHWILSASPELFFTREGGRITARPMKGTAPRAADPAADAASAASLAADPKERAENLMIVDLLRNDLSRVAVPGSVRVPDLFTVETYPTLHTLTSTVVADSLPDADAVTTLRALFPCGSITGAPKIRAMEVIRMVEPDARGLYTGSIGWIGPNDDSAFNVAIRTLTMPAAETPGRTATLGLGSAVVADSTADAEWRECLLKARFVTHTDHRFDLIETMKAVPGHGIVDRDLHLARLAASSATLGFEVPADLTTQLDGAVAGLEQPVRVRLALASDGTVAVQVAPLPDTHAEPVPVAIVPLPVDTCDFRLRHKTSDRGFYDTARSAAGTFEVVFVDPAGYLTEGSFTSLFVERDGRLLTPPATRGLLPGILRRRLIEDGRAIEADLRPDDLADGFLIGNALRGLIAAVPVGLDAIA